jgi:hypothetical protein
MYTKFQNYSISSDSEDASSTKLLDNLQEELNKEIERIRKSGCPRLKIADLALLMDIMREKDLDRLDRVLLYRIARQKGNMDLELFCWLEDILMLVRYNKIKWEDLRNVLHRIGWSQAELEAQINPSLKKISHVKSDRSGDRGNEVINDQHRPIIFNGDSMEYSRIDTEPLRIVQAALNGFIDRICSAEDSGHLVDQVTELLSYLLETEFFCSHLVSDMLRACHPESESYVDALKALRGAAFHCFEQNYISPRELDEAMEDLLRNKASLLKKGLAVRVD